MVNPLGPRLSTACLYNLTPAQDNIQRQHQMDGVSPVSTVHTPIVSTVQLPSERAFVEEKHTFVSPAETKAYFPDDKICLVAEGGLEFDNGQRNNAIRPAGAVLPPNYTAVAVELPDRPQKPWWKRHLIWILLGVVLVIILAAVVGKFATHHSRQKPVALNSIIPNNTQSSIATTGLFLQDGKSWNTHVFWQNSTGGITLQTSLDGSKTYAAPRNVALSIPPKVGSPLSATAEQDEQTGVVMINLFYISGVNNITMSAITCASGSSNCNTISNCYLPTTKAVNVNTGLAAVNVNDAQDWRVYYHDNAGYISQLQGNASGFNTGERIGGLGLNASDIAAVNVNSTTNNICLFYTDLLTQQLFTMQFTKDSWTTPSLLTSELVPVWNPTSGLAAAYSSTQDQLHVYFTGLDQGIYEFLGNNASQTTNATWAPQPGRNHVWAKADYVGADITAVGWKDQVRFFQRGQGKLVEGSLGGSTWTESFVN